MPRRRATWIEEWQQRNPGKSLRDHLASLRDNGHTQTEIGQLFGTTRFSVNRAFRDFGLSERAANEAVPA